ncbi:MAG: hypothetical protein ABI613_02320 [Gemmatimonadota bacterium]
MRGYRWFNLLLLSGLAACAGWKSLPGAPDSPSPDAAFQVWASGESYALYDLHVTPDSVSGTPLMDDRHCRQCSVSLSREAMDSIREGDRARGTAETFGIMAGAMTGLLLIGILLYTTQGID